MNGFLKIFFLCASCIILGCKNNFDKINTRDDAIKKPSSESLFNYGLKHIASELYDQLTLCFILPWVGYINFGNNFENGLGDRLHLLNNRISYQFLNYSTANQFKKIIELNEKKEFTREREIQIALSMSMIIYFFNIITDAYGDIPCYSYYDEGNNDFQALNIYKYPTSRLTSQEMIYKSHLTDLKKISLMLEVSEINFSFKEFLYNGELKKWIKFINSIRLRIANRVKHKGLAEALSTIEELKNSSELILNNSDNAIFRYGNTFFDSMEIFKKLKFSPSLFNFKIHRNLVDMLKGKKIMDIQNSNPFEGILDPRLFSYASSKEMDFEKILVSNGSNKILNPEDYLGASSTDNVFSGEYSTIGYEILKPDASVYFMSAAETYFILAENGDKNAYEKGIRASMEQWGVESKFIEEYLKNSKIKIKENKMEDKKKIIIQKYIALFMQPMESWALVRRHRDLFEEVLKLDSVPFRLTYYETLKDLNLNVNEGINNLSNGDTIKSKFWWMKD